MWTVPLDPGPLVGRDGVTAFALPAIVVVAITIGFMAAVGRRLMRKRAGLAVLLGSAFAPTLMIAIALLAASRHPAGTDGGGILTSVALALAVYALPVTAATSVLYVRVRRRR